MCEGEVILFLSVDCHIPSAGADIHGQTEILALSARFCFLGRRKTGQEKYGKNQKKDSFEQESGRSVFHSGFHHYPLPKSRFHQGFFLFNPLMTKMFSHLLHRHVPYVSLKWVFELPQRGHRERSFFAVSSSMFFQYSSFHPGRPAMKSSIQVISYYTITSP